LLSAFLAPRAALAGSSADVAAAQGLYDEARKLMKDGKYAAACPKLEESQRLDKSRSTEFHLADCYEHTGRSVSAWALFLQVASESKAAGRADAEKLARQRANDLAPKLARLTLNVPQAAQVEGLQVKRDTDAVGSAQWGSAVPVDPGKHTVSASAPGRVDWSTSVDVPEGKAVETEVPTLAPIPTPLAQAATAPTPHAPAANGVDGRHSDAIPDDSGRSTRGTIGLIVGSAGVIALGVGTYFGLQALSKYSDSNQGADGCVSDMCRLTGYNTRNDARAAGDLSTAFIGGGAAALVAGGVLWLTARPHAGHPAATAPGLHVGLAPTGLRIEGAFR
jgi:serine/threonine-protein kinase